MYLYQHKGPLTMQQKDILADVAAGASAATASWTWLAQANDLLQLVATGVAIVAGIYAIRWHKVRIELASKKEKKDEPKS